MDATRKEACRDVDQAYLDAIREEARSDASCEEECSDAIHKQAACSDALREEACRDIDQAYLEAIREEARSDASCEEECSGAIH